MSDEKTPESARQIQIITGDEMARGRYSNSMAVSHSPEEFIVEWLLNSPSGTHLVSRVIVSPGHMKRIVDALSENLQKYENKYGPVRPAGEDDQAFH